MTTGLGSSALCAFGLITYKLVYKTRLENRMTAVRTAGVTLLQCLELPLALQSKWEFFMFMAVVLDLKGMLLGVSLSICY